MARKKTLFQGLTIGPDIELLIVIGGVGLLAWWLWSNYGSNALQSIESDVSGAVSDVTGGQGS